MDTQAFQHLLSLFPLLTLRQRRLAQQELTPPSPHHLVGHSTSRMPMLPSLPGRGHTVGSLGLVSRAAPLSLQAVSAHQFRSH